MGAVNFSVSHAVFDPVAEAVDAAAGIGAVNAAAYTAVFTPVRVTMGALRGRVEDAVFDALHD